ncbi:MAG: glycerol-3-phosphate dehydrogenase/oxidase [Acidobacteriota bacterium]
MDRKQMLGRLRGRREPWDLAVIGGGATGVGIALDAAARGYDAILLEQNDFGKGTSSRSTKLAHGGVRYLKQGNIPLVVEALRERALMRRNAPHLVRDLAFVVPNYHWWEGPFYGAGLRLYSRLAGKYGFGPSLRLSRAETLEHLPAINAAGLRGGVLYYDGQFDDTRLLIHLARTAAARGAVLLNYVRVTGLEPGGVTARDEETGEEFRVPARMLINAAGPFADAIRRMAGRDRPMIAQSQGVHLVLDGSFLGGERALMVPHTPDGRVLFALPWYGHTLVGTTDTPIAAPSLEPVPMDQEVEFILSTAGRYLGKPPTRGDVLSAWAGIRPLVRSSKAAATAALSRDHTIRVEGPGLLTIAGGKWTTYRRMAEDCVNRAAESAALPKRPCVTRELNIHGYHLEADKFGALAPHGADAPAIEELMRNEPSLAQPLHQRLPYRAAEAVWAARHEMARTVEDVLARRTRALFLDARAAMEMAPQTAALLARELGRDAVWEAEQVRRFRDLARGYLT